MIEDNYIHDCTVGVFDKDSGKQGDGTNRPTYRRNWLTHHRDSQFLGNNQGDQARYYIYDNVVDGTINLYTLNTGSQIYNNLVRSAGAVTSWQSSYQQNIWNNIVLANKQAVSGYGASEVPFSTGRSDSPLRYMDYNVYDGNPSFSFKDVSYTLAQFRSRGFERHAAVVPGAASIFRDLTSYESSRAG